MHITKKYIFEQKLKGEPVRIMKGNTTAEEAQILVDAGIMRVDYERHGAHVAIALYPVVCCGITRTSGFPDEYRETHITPGRYLHY